MINKQNLWFVTLFSLILILGIYYVSIDDKVTEVLKSDEVFNNKEVIEINESDILVALEVQNEEEKEALREEYQNIILNTESTLKEKNEAYENMQELNTISNEEEKIKNKLTEELKLKVFAKINGNNISITVASNKHDTTLANNIIRSVQSLYKDNKYITVKFQ